MQANELREILQAEIDKSGDIDVYVCYPSGGPGIPMSYTNVIGVYSNALELSVTQGNVLSAKQIVDLLPDIGVEIILVDMDSDVEGEEFGIANTHIFHDYATGPDEVDGPDTFVIVAEM